MVQSMWIYLINVARCCATPRTAPRVYRLASEYVHYQYKDRHHRMEAVCRKITISQVLHLFLTNDRPFERTRWLYWLIKVVIITLGLEKMISKKASFLPILFEHEYLNY